VFSALGRGRQQVEFVKFDVKHDEFKEGFVVFNAGYGVFNSAWVEFIQGCVGSKAKPPGSA
jgi:hypothetical protein